jgi:hypothetical protein
MCPIQIRFLKDLILISIYEIENQLFLHICAYLFGYISSDSIAYEISIEPRSCFLLFRAGYIAKFYGGCHGNVVVHVFLFQAGYLGGMSLVIALRGSYSDDCRKQLIG